MEGLIRSGVNNHTLAWLEVVHATPRVAHVSRGIWVTMPGGATPKPLTSKRLTTRTALVIVFNYQRRTSGQQCLITSSESNLT